LYGQLIAVLPSQDGGVVLIGNAGERVLVVEQRANVLLETSDKLGISEKRCNISRRWIVVILTCPAIWSVGIVSDQGYDQAQAAIVRSLQE
jgi:hypothetical protein